LRKLLHLVVCKEDYRRRSIYGIVHYSVVFYLGVEVVGDIKEGWERILSPEAVQFLADVHRNFEPTRQSVLQTRIDRQKLIDQGEELKVSFLFKMSVNYI